MNAPALRIKDGCFAILANTDNAKLWLVTTSTGREFFCRKQPDDIYCAWVDLDALCEGDRRVYASAPTLTKLIEVLDEIGPTQERIVSFTQNKEQSMTTADQDKQEIFELREGVASGEFEDELAVAECLIDIARDNPAVQDLSLGAIVDILETNHGPAMAVAA